MSHLSWNCRGLGRALIVQKLRELIHSHAPSMVFLMEAKLNNHRVSMLKRQLGFFKGFCVDLVGLAGGLTLWWSPEANLANFALVNSPPWLYIGDLNEILENNEKEGGNSWPWCRTRFLRSFMDTNGLLDLRSTSQFFTWDNRQDAASLVILKLDRWLINTLWLYMWLDSCVHVEPRIGFDHSPFVLHFAPRVRRRRKNFKFEAYWADNLECDSIIQKGWNCDQNGDSLSTLSANLGGCRQRNCIESLLTSEGVCISGDQGVRNEFDNFFGNLFTSQGPRNWGSTLQCVHRSITDAQNTYLTAPFSVEEVRTVVKQLGLLKAPGSDRFLGLFYDRFWEIVQHSINDLVTEFFSGNCNLDLLNHTHIVLIPKVPKPTSVNQFRPISLCKNSYKILSKLLANRLKPLLPNLISQHQNAFVPGRQIQDNILLAHEAFHYLRLKTSRKAFELGLKLDMNKAYDRVEWDFLEATLCQFGFNNRWISLVMMYVKSVSFSLVLNGSPGDRFSPSRGLRQGDPLSPYLFLLISEGIKLSRGCPGLSYLYFADDSLFFLQASPSNCIALKAILDYYCASSGQEVNSLKSSLHFSPNTDKGTRNNCGNIFGIPATCDPGPYFGLPTFWGCSKVAALAYVLDRINQNIAGWKQNFLSQAGREVLIKSVATAVPAYPMSCFSLPITLCNAINADLTSFWWGHSREHGKIH
ncbi:hypothetical protein GBA52_020666 [Prunus armeniaca]|nr:hypothetical protein GBA52_020666 [Prunus armeniaca]